MRIENYLRAHAQKTGEKTALVTGQVRLTYAEFDAKTEALAQYLQAQTVQRGDRVVIFMDNCWPAAVSVFAILKAGAVFTLVNPSTKADKLGYILNDCTPSLLLTQAKLLPVIDEAEAFSKIPAVIAVQGPSRSKRACLSFEEAVTPQPDSTPLVNGGIDIDLAMLIYTSGSTGRPKGVMMTHRNIDAAATSLTGLLKNTADDIILSVLPLSFNYGLYQLLMAIKLGATLILEKSFAFPQAVFDLMRAEKVTGFPIVPTMSAIMMQMKDLTAGFLPDLRFITNTAAQLPVPHIAFLQRVIPDAEIYSMYGLTECKRCTWLPPQMISQKPESVGIALPNSEVYLVDEQGQPVAIGEAGEMVVRGPNVMQGYWNNPEASAEVLRTGRNPWEKVLHTGDLLRMDADGYYYFVGRKDDIIKSRGEKVPPKEVETVLYSHPAIREAVVAGVPDVMLGQAITALVTTNDTALNDKEIIRFCRQNLEDYMVPVFVLIADELPRTDTGKVSRRLAAEILAKQYRQFQDE
ncbi:acyl--CoA ligase [Bacillus subtilis]|uniref:class I adenylate-forming enzyme family protein n=1 Tax=Pseudochrobactrum asaccharolyticum TaxID=354351 RepID=UPI001F23FA62|nr:class I adenylate-forming enzyme family protein [Pseudochrobactrum asaccharolyticum]MCF7646377.1 acyl--CoA ligase [Pseudochrobactrum asaccharolyticum]MCF7673247.1 acyl--CoA ligase [Bacillus subtilis]